ncbi:MAG TPA: tyrosine-type recombinase/integrase [Stellaceae bacterium]|nr:tyrosine-type recombinase/integrase [Stellaceae bacterium]
MAHYRLDHLELRGHQWYARLNVPADVQAKFRRRKFRVALKTTDRKVARDRAAFKVAEWRELIERARGKSVDEMRSWREVLRRADSEDKRKQVFDEIVEEALRHHGFLSTVHFDEEATEEERAKVARHIGVATGGIVETSEYLDEWINSLHTKSKTTAMRRQTIERLAAKFLTLADISRKEVVRWVSELRSELSSATVQRLMSDCRVYWAYLRSLEVAPDIQSPFERLGFKKPKHRSWLPYEPGQAVRLLKAAKGDLTDLIRLAMYTGARREELCALRLEHVKADRFEIMDAKTEAGVRTVPINTEIKATLKRMIGKRREGFLFEHLKTDRHGKRGDQIGKQFTALKQHLGFDDRHSFHSFRGTVITMLERAGVPESTAQDIVGHERSTLTGSTYSGKSTFEMRKAALAKLSYPA